jgi:hypothetical protein
MRSHRHDNEGDRHSKGVPESRATAKGGRVVRPASPTEIGDGLIFGETVKKAHEKGQNHKEREANKRGRTNNGNHFL